ncbi:MULTISPECIES: isocitrate lyase/PEP mutase family protein [Thalassospira]|jgi:2-methylisocitrate lyase-like PEP mutase family enzyme|uniref:Carboxyvinyl-carboxyphosphonate phosphorylmutase n=2 Tax=Thalassospira TaxID=168934 RepID=A0ABR5XY10_9PROT|nr:MULTISPECIES: isocitrate lyase/PEP mutase family protein [Thalassospira]MBL4840911.1 isocitrate lyase/PEP mutase family protein [Thalassospira sp.]MBR9782283.1 isocitrate lyase/PEP mutase family protein [Rhodospirillales bacterium]KEO51138.1 carboxyvinyl-carboxyphosphonate phosphorylmutase [Thalassospira permensis NBRC 106175]KZD01180.1 carboxyvinyl-carboxyphosphonate phosphorylmutase [Thalassospira xiamenensis]KZD02905.1 carboxyvinyl-carboxyphosphonate phosphorylmutase [Thalassospira xiame|tara:strand:+ start:836 stop:1717 length:882 start_codon:yes stop_codon:yes gene_type:complete
MTKQISPADKLRALLATGDLITMPCCFDALSAKLIEQEGFGLTFMSGFSAAASRIGEPDLGLMSYGEVLDQARNITDAVSIPVIGDGDTGYGNAMNVKRTVAGFAKAGCAAVMIEDQLAPKRCGHTKGKEVVGRDEAFDRIKAAVDAREAGADILILARTDARHQHGLSEAIDRAAKFAELGADILFVEAPKTVAEMRELCAALPGPKMANIVEGGETPDLTPEELSDIGYQIAAYPLSLMAAAMKAMVETLQLMKAGKPRTDMLMDWGQLRNRIGFDAYYEESERYATSKRG